MEIKCIKKENRHIRMSLKNIKYNLNNNNNNDNKNILIKKEPHILEDKIDEIMNMVQQLQLQVRTNTKHYKQ